jgi:hypothetical protein
MEELVEEVYAKEGNVMVLVPDRKIIAEMWGWIAKVDVV